MYLFGPTIDPIVFTSLAILLPAILTALSRAPTPIPLPLIHGTRRTQPPAVPHRQPLNIALLIHTLITLYRLIFARPPNIFTFLNVPLSISGPKLRTLMQNMAQKDSGQFVWSPSLDDLITRLSSFDVRTIFIRFGQQTVESCTHCHTHSDYALYSLPRPLLEYVREAAFIGLITIRGSGPVLEQRRTLGVALLVFAAVAEAWWLYTVPIALRNTKEDITMWHDLCWIFRQLLFLTLPLILHTLNAFPPSYPPINPSQQPSRPPISPFLRFLSRLPFPLSLLFYPFALLLRPPLHPPPPPLKDSILRAARTTEAVSGRLTLLQLARGALSRDEELRERVGRWWEVQKGAGKAVRMDEGVQEGARRRGLGYVCLGDERGDNVESVAETDVEDDKEANVLGKMAREAVEGLKKFGLSPIP